MGLPATNLNIDFDLHAISVGIYQDLIPAITVDLGFDVILKAVRTDPVGLTATIEAGFEPTALARRLDDCSLPATTLAFDFGANVLEIQAPFPPVTVDFGLTFAGTPEGMLDAVDGPIPMTFSGGVEAYFIFNNPNLNALDVCRQVYYMWGFPVKDVKKIGIGLDSITMWLNAAMQLIYSRAEQLDYFNRQTLPLTIGTSGLIELPTTIQRVQGPVVIAATKKTLRPLRTSQELQQFSQRFLDASSVAPAAPLAYYVETTRVSAADSVKSTLYLTPEPSADLNIEVVVTHEPPRYSESDLLYGRILEIPHVWAETILIPLVKKWALSDPTMPSSSRETLQQGIETQYRSALQMLGLAEVEAPAVTRSKPKEEQPAP